MKYTDNALNIIVAKTYKGIGKAWIVKNLKGNESVDAIVKLLNKNNKEIGCISIIDFDMRKNKLIKHLQKMEGFADGVVAIGDLDFPENRGKVKNSEKPIYLFYKGDLSLLNKHNNNVAVIGLLNPDPATIEVEQKVVSSLVVNGATIVSGLALGCDTVAHQQALSSNGKTIAILPSPLNDILPASNKELAKQILEYSGLLITEYFYDVKSKIELSSRYQERDRLQALYSDAIILSASYAKNEQGNDSGSRLAMAYAYDYDIPRFVIYDEILDADNPKYDLNRQLIKDDKKITVISGGNVADRVKSIFSSAVVLAHTSNDQLGLF